MVRVLILYEIPNYNVDKALNCNIYVISQALAVAVVKTVVTPMELIGQGIRNFLVGLLKGLPLQIQTFVLICLFCLVILWPLLLMGYNFNFFYLINIGPQRVVKEIQVSAVNIILKKEIVI